MNETIISKRLCKNCIHCKKAFFRFMCDLPISEDKNMVTGKIKRKYYSCNQQREYSKRSLNAFKNFCGHEGTYFKVKDWFKIKNWSWWSE